MKLSSFTVLAMVLMLALGIVFGGWIFRDVPTIAAPEDRLDTTAAMSTRVELMADNSPATPAFTEQPEEASYLGVIFPRQAADVVARTEGLLQSVQVNLGDRVKAGEIIARADSYSSSQHLRITEATLAAAQAEQRDAELEAKDAEIRYQRRVELAAAGLVSMEDLSAAQVSFNRAQAKLETAQAHVAEQTARVNDGKESLSNTVIRAPFDGTVAARFLDAGAAVRFGTPVISLMRPEDLWVRFAIRQSQPAPISVGATIEFQPEHWPASISGLVEYVSPSVTSASQEVLVEARLRGPAGFQNRVRPGETGIVSVHTR